MASRQARRIARQSSTASRTSASTRVSAAASSSSSAGSAWRSISMCIIDSDSRPLAGFDGEAQKVAVEVAPRRQHGMGQQMDGDLAAIELVGDRIDQERHVVVDDLHDGVAAFEAVVGGGGVEHPDLGDARQAAAGEGQQGGRGAGALLGRSRRQVLVGDAANRRRAKWAASSPPPPARRRRWHPARRHAGPVRWPWMPSRSAMVPADVTSDHDNLTTEIGVAESAHHILCFGGCLTQDSRFAAVSVPGPRNPRQSAFCSLSMLRLRRFADGRKS